MTTVITNMFAKIKDNMYRKWLIQLNNSAFRKVYTFFQHVQNMNLISGDNKLHSFGENAIINITIN